MTSFCVWLLSLLLSWKRAKNGAIFTDGEGKYVLQFVGIKRKDTGEWALPGVFIKEKQRERERDRRGDKLRRGEMCMEWKCKRSSRVSNFVCFV